MERKIENKAGKEKIVIVGAGIAGLTAGIFGCKSGYEVEVYEKNTVVGGQCTGWSRNGFFIDNCIHWLTGTKKGTPICELWEEVGALGNGIEVIQPDIFYTVELNGESITLWADLERTRREMLELSPEDADEINHFIESVRIAECMQMPVDKPMDMMNVMDYMKMGSSMKPLVKILKEFGTISLKEYADRFHHPLLCHVFTDYMAKEYVASSLILSYTTITSGQGGIPRGGSKEMVLRMQQKLEAGGGKIFTGANVAKVVLEGKRASGIMLADGTRKEADYVICTCDTDFTFGTLLPRTYMDVKMQKEYESEEAYPVNSGFQIAFSVDSLMEEVDGTFVFSCDEIQIASRKEHRMSIRNYAYERSFAPEGKTVIQSNFIQYEKDYEYWKELYENDREKYNAVKQLTAKMVLARIEERFPEYAGKIHILDVWTPVTYQRYFNAYQGAYMSFIMTTKGKNLTFKGTVKNLENVYLASQWQRGPGGLPTAMTMGKFSIYRIDKKNKRV